MTSFLDKLKKKEKEEERPKREPRKVKREIPEGFAQLDVDILQTPSEIIVYAPMAGSDIQNLDVVMEEYNDVVTIRGGRERPEMVETREQKWLVQECEWGSFFRQIILPREIDVSKIKAKFKKGVLILRLPFLEEKEGEEEAQRVKVSDIG